MMIKVYGIKNCDSVKKALSWLKQNNLEYQFHDYKKDGIDQVLLERFVKIFGVEAVLNKKGTSWRKLADEERAKVVDDKSAIALMLENASMIKRPILDDSKGQLIGFKEAEYQNIFGA